MRKYFFGIWTRTTACDPAVVDASAVPSDAAAVDAIPRGTIWHRIWECPTLDGLRLQCAPARLPPVVRDSFTSGEKKLLCHGLLFERATDLQPPSSEATFVWVKWPDMGVATVKTERYRVYSDGSRLDTDCEHTARLGWAFVVADDDGCPVASDGVPPP